MTNFFRRSADSRESSVVVWFLGDFGDEFRVDDFVVAIEDDDSSRGESRERSGSDFDAVVLAKRRTEGRKRFALVDAFSTTETLLSEGQVFGNIEDRDALVRRVFVELTDGRGAHRRVDARENVEDFLARERSEGSARQVTAKEAEIRGGVANFGQVASGGDGIALQRNGCHGKFLRCAVGRLSWQRAGRIVVRSSRPTRVGMYRQVPGTCGRCDICYI